MSDKNLQEKENSEEEIKVTSEEKTEGIEGSATEEETTEEIVENATEEVEAEEAFETEDKEVEAKETFETEDKEEEPIEENDTDEEEGEESEEEEEEELDYHALSKKELITELIKLLKDKPIQSIKNAVEEIRSEFNSKFQEELELKKEEFLATGGNIIDFHYTTPLKKEFSSLYFDYKEKRNNYYKNLKRDLQDNLSKRLELIEELKGLLNMEENINTTYKHFKEIQEKWHVAGAIPRDKYNTVWNTYHHHVENFYDFLHLNREFRDLDFKHNLEQKLKIIGRAEELANAS